MTLLGEGMRPTEKSLLQLADQAGIPAPSAQAIIKEVRDAISGWSEFAALAGVRKITSKKIASFFEEMAGV